VRARARKTPQSHDWHVQPVVKDRIAYRLSGAFRSSLKHRSASRPRILRLRPPCRAAICRKPFKHTANCCCWSTPSGNFLHNAVALFDYPHQTQQNSPLQQVANRARINVPPSRTERKAVQPCDTETNSSLRKFVKDRVEVLRNR